MRDLDFNGAAIQDQVKTDKIMGLAKTKKRKAQRLGKSPRNARKGGCFFEATYTI